MESEKSYSQIRKETLGNSLATIRSFSEKGNKGEVIEALDSLIEMDEARERELKQRSDAALFWKQKLELQESLYNDSVAVLKELSSLAKSALEGNIQPDERKRLDEICSRF